MVKQTNPSVLKTLSQSTDILNRKNLIQYVLEMDEINHFKKEYELECENIISNLEDELNVLLSKETERRKEMNDRKEWTLSFFNDFAISIKKDLIQSISITLMKHFFYHNKMKPLSEIFYVEDRPFRYHEFSTVEEFLNERSDETYFGLHSIKEKTKEKAFSTLVESGVEEINCQKGKLFLNRLSKPKQTVYKLVKKLLSENQTASDKIDEYLEELGKQDFKTFFDVQISSDESLAEEWKKLRLRRMLQTD